MKINRDYISKKNINGTGNPCKYITIHETDNYNKGADAKCHAKAQHDGNFRDMSVHYYCGSDGIYQAAEHTCKCWHVGRTYVSTPNNPDCTNNNSIGIEICVNSDGNYTVARQNAIDLVKYLIATTGIPADRVIRHYDAKGKHCPRKMLDTPSLWTDFKNQIKGGAVTQTPEVDTTWKAIGTAICTGNGVNYRPRPTLNCSPIGQLGKGNRFEIDGQEKDGWVHIKVADTQAWISKTYVQYDGQPVQTAAPSKTPSGWKATGTATCTGSDVNVRSTPEICNNVVWELGKGNRFEVDGQKNGSWVHINVQGTIGWVSETYVKYDGQPTSIPTTPSKTSSGWKAIGTATCTGNGVRVRSTPDASRTDNIIRELGKGNRFEIDGQTQNGFCHIKVENNVGWISGNYVQKD